MGASTWTDESFRGFAFFGIFIALLPASIASIIPAKGKGTTLVPSTRTPTCALAPRLARNVSNRIPVSPLLRFDSDFGDQLAPLRERHPRDRGRHLQG